VSGFYSLTVWFSDADARSPLWFLDADVRSWPSGENVTALTGLLWLFSVYTVIPVPGFYSLTV
jgi:hypothetical protein